MRKSDLDPFASRRPFEPFGIRLVDGQRFHFTRLEQIMVGRTAIGALTKKGDLFLINRALISTLHPAKSNGRGHARKAAGGR